MKDIKMKKIKKWFVCSLLAVAGPLADISSGWAGDYTNFLDIQILNMDFFVWQKATEKRMIHVSINGEKIKNT